MRDCSFLTENVDTYLIPSLSTVHVVFLLLSTTTNSIVDANAKSLDCSTSSVIIGQTTASVKHSPSLLYPSRPRRRHSIRPLDLAVRSRITGR